MSETTDWTKPVKEQDYSWREGCRGTLLPWKEDFPDEFWNHDNEWNRLAAKLFHQGADLVFKNTINESEAEWHITKLCHSTDCKHEHKIAGLAYLLSLWCVKSGIKRKRGWL